MRKGGDARTASRDVESDPNGTAIDSVRLRLVATDA
jgi:hypothetical protein